MNIATDLLNTILRAKSEVLRDIASGRVPATVKSFSELHDYVDANYYGGAFGHPDSRVLPPKYFDCSDEACTFWNAVQDEVDAWIKRGLRDRREGLRRNVSYKGES